MVSPFEEPSEPIDLLPRLKTLIGDQAVKIVALEEMVARLERQITALTEQEHNTGTPDASLDR